MSSRSASESAGWSDARPHREVIRNANSDTKRFYPCLAPAASPRPGRFLATVKIQTDPAAVCSAAVRFCNLRVSGQILGPDDRLSFTYIKALRCIEAGSLGLPRRPRSFILKFSTFPYSLPRSLAWNCDDFDLDFDSADKLQHLRCSHGRCPLRIEIRIPHLSQFRHAAHVSEIDIHLHYVREI